MLVIGGRDMDAGAVSVRLHGKGNLGAKPKAEVLADILAAVRAAGGVKGNYQLCINSYQIDS